MWEPAGRPAREGCTAPGRRSRQRTVAVAGSSAASVRPAVDADEEPARRPRRVLATRPSRVALAAALDDPQPPPSADEQPPGRRQLERARPGSASGVGAATTSRTQRSNARAGPVSRAVTRPPPRARRPRPTRARSRGAPARSRPACAASTVCRARSRAATSSGTAASRAAPARGRSRVSRSSRARARARRARGAGAS